MQFPPTPADPQAFPAGRTVGTTEAFARLLRRTREINGLTQKQLADRMGVSRKWVLEAETGKTRTELGKALDAFYWLGYALRLDPLPEHPFAEEEYRRRFLGDEDRSDAT